MSALFEVWLGDDIKFSTNSPNCIPDNSTIRSMKNAGYTIKKNGKKLTNQDIATDGKNGGKN